MSDDPRPSRLAPSGAGEGGGASAPSPFPYVIGCDPAMGCGDYVIHGNIIRNVESYPARLERDHTAGVGPKCASCSKRGTVRVSPDIYACTACGTFSALYMGDTEPVDPSQEGLSFLRLLYAEVEREGGDCSKLARPWEVISR